MEDKPKIKTVKQKRALVELLKGIAIPVKEIGPLIGALNPRQTIMELRKQGFECIKTRRYHDFNEFGERTSPGEYYLTPGSRDRVIEALNKFHSDNGRFDTFNHKVGG